MENCLRKIWPTLCLNINYMIPSKNISSFQIVLCQMFYMWNISPGCDFVTDLKLILHCGHNLSRSQPRELIEYSRPSSPDKQAVTTVSSSCAGSLVTPMLPGSDQQTGNWHMAGGPQTDLWSLQMDGPGFRHLVRTKQCA